MRIDGAGWTHVGRRSHNEDSWTVRADLGLFVVADGLGGYEGGEVASRRVVDVFSGFCERVAQDPEATWPHNLRPGYSREEDLLLNCTLLAQRAVLSRRVGHLREMGSTVVALALGARGAAVAHVGDSRLYRLREGRLEALTRDHSGPERIAARLGRRGRSLDVAERLVHEAYAAGGTDNITAVVVGVGAE